MAAGVRRARALRREGGVEGHRHEGGSVGEVVPSRRAQARVYRAAKGLDIYMYKAYLQSNSEVRALFFDETPTTVSSMSVVADTPIYTLEGLRVKSPTKTGLYIKGGKVMLVKSGKK